MSKGEVKHEKHHKRLSALRDKTQKRIDYHLKKPFVESEEFYHLITEFFLELLEKDYAATYEDILDELEKIEHEQLLFSREQRDRAGALLKVLSQLEYMHEEIPQEHAKKILDDFARLADDFTRLEEESIQRVLREGFHAVKRKDLKAAKQAYQKAHQMYERLGEHDKQLYFKDVQGLFAMLKE